MVRVQQIQMGRKTITKLPQGVRTTTSTMGRPKTDGTMANHSTQVQKSAVTSNNKRKTTNPLKNKRKAPNQEYALRDIERLQNTTHTLIPKAAFYRLVKEIVRDRDVAPFNHMHGYQFQARAIHALQEAAEVFLTGVFEDSNLCVIHRRHVTIFPKDMQLVLRLRGILDTMTAIK